MKWYIIGRYVITYHKSLLSRLSIITTRGKYRLIKGIIFEISFDSVYIYSSLFYTIGKMGVNICFSCYGSRPVVRGLPLGK